MMHSNHHAASSLAEELMVKDFIASADGGEVLGRKLVLMVKDFETRADCQRLNSKS